MSNVKAMNSTYINYYVPGQLDPENVRLVTLNGMDVNVLYKTHYNTYIPNGINYIIGLLSHWGRKRTKPQEQVFISNKNIV